MFNRLKRRAETENSFAKHIKPKIFAALVNFSNDRSCACFTVGNIKKCDHSGPYVFTHNLIGLLGCTPHTFWQSVLKFAAVAILRGTVALRGRINTLVFE
jgi:hypothetical protein